MTGSPGRIAAVAAREVRGLTRARGTFLLRSLWAALCALAVLAILGRGSGRGLASAAAATFAVLAWGQCLLASLAGVVLAVASVAEERRQRTLGLLVLSGLRPWEIVVGKGLGLLGILGMLAVAPLPVLGLLGWAGGIEYAFLGRLIALTLLLAAFGVAAGLAWGLRFAGALWGGVASIAAVVFWVLVLPAAAVLLSRHNGWPQEEVLPFTPLGAVLEVASQGSLHVAGAASSLSEHALPVVLALLGGLVLWEGTRAVRRIGRAASQTGGGGLRGVFERLDILFERINIGRIRLGRPSRRRPLSGNPVAWLARTSGGMGLPHYGFRLVASVVLLVLFLVAAGFVGNETGTFWLMATAIALLPVALLLVALALGAGAVAGERVRRSLPVLLVTPLRGKEILAGKARVFLAILGGVCAGSVALLVPLGGLLDPDIPLGILVAVLVVGADWLLAFVLALACSLLLRTPLRAGAAALGLLLLVNVGVPAIWGLFGEAWGGVFVAGAGGRSLVLWGLVASLVLGLLARRRRRRWIAVTAAAAALGPAAAALVWCTVEGAREGRSVWVLAWPCLLLSALAASAGAGARGWARRQPAWGFVGFLGSVVVGTGALLAVPCDGQDLARLAGLDFGNWEDFVTMALAILAFAWALYAYAVRTFDRAVGRSA